MKSLSIGANGMLAQQINVDVIANNIANMSTTGYKRQQAEFADLMYQSPREPGSDSASDGSVLPSGIQLGLGTKLVSTHRIHEQGTFSPTGNDLDVAINGNGFFQIQMPSGEVGYTRNGTFQRSPEGEIVTANGYIVSPGIAIPEDALGITINANGDVFADIDGQSEPQNLGQIELATFVNPAGLKALGDNLFVETAASGSPVAGTPGEDGLGSLQQAFIESSNVNVVQEITNLIQAQRAYEMNSKVVKAADEMSAAIVQTA
jgi:flagellar basal-body rod protein FlgG